MLLKNSPNNSSKVCILCGAPDLISCPDIASSCDELVCQRCGAVTPTPQSSVVGTEKFWRAPTSSLIWGGGLGTNYATKNPDGTSDSYALHGDNGKYAQPVNSVIKPWDLQTIIEPDGKIRAVQQKLASIGKQNEFKDEDLHFMGEPIIGTIHKVQEAERHMLVDSETHDTFDPEDPVLFKAGGRHFLRAWLKDIQGARKS